MHHHTCKLDTKIVQLENDGQIASEPNASSLMRDSLAGGTSPQPPPAAQRLLNKLRAARGNPLDAHQAATARAAHAAMPAAAMASPIQHVMSTQPVVAQSRLANEAPAQPRTLMTAAAAAAAAVNRERELAAATDAKRRRAAGPGAMPSASSALARPASIGPGTPKPGTPTSRSGSVGPKPSKKTATKRIPPTQQPLRKQLTANKAAASLDRKKKRRSKSGARASPATTADDESVASEAPGSDDDASAAGGLSGAVDSANDDDGDDTKYCFCQRVSFGNMVGCDNEACRYQWFHWGCVDIKDEPEGDWLCPVCRNVPASRIKKGR